MNKANQNFNVQKWVAGVSVILLAVKFYAYYTTHSISILTDALESIVNVAAGFIGLYSLYVAAKPRDHDHPYGHGKAEFLSAAIEGTMILSAGAIILYKATKSIFEPVPIHGLDGGIILVAITALINFGVGYYCLRIGRKNNSDALVASGKHLQSLNRMVQLLNGNRRENWVDLHNLRVIRYGSVLHVDCHLTVPWYLNVHQAHSEIDALAELIRKEFGESLELFVHSDGCLPFSCRICGKEICSERKNNFEQRIEWTLENISSNKKHQLK
ncbi:MAG: cation transporter [Chitinophagaceae bacterium]|nr:cation transporter [Chitinophagaceae bacterium]